MEAMKMSKERHRAYIKYLLELWHQAKGFPNFYSFGSISIDRQVKEVWGDWQTQDKPYDFPFNTYQELDDKEQKEKKISKWGKEIILKLKTTPGFRDCPSSKLSDKAIVTKVWMRWQQLKGPYKMRRITKELLEERWTEN
jgi:hypothetical protein